jgi:hypothetical protein
MATDTIPEPRKASASGVSSNADMVILYHQRHPNIY